MSYASATQPSSSFVPVPRLNVEYSVWIRTVQALMTWLFASISESMLGHVIHSIAENLAAAGQALTDDDLLLYILGSLDSEYDSVIVNLTSRPEAISLPEAQFMLWNQEIRIDQAHSISLVDPHFANLAQKNGGRSGFSKNGGSISGHYNNGGRGNRGGGGFRGCPRGRGDQGRGDHRPQSGSSSTPLTYVASSTTVNDPSWYIESGATDHITSDLANQTVSSDYKGKEKIQVGNSNNLSIFTYWPYYNCS
ncbi:hypothetical protein TorRG33x02_276610 [Trema orientale]|uniref:Uncharacterized protein n=1 Tax=Trema orientale TaxID=63057 RepID=A0A2P5CQN2_TREOI|nr:hypothetical protein TorRG33x02_276610 [Trema orientale]